MVRVVVLGNESTENRNVGRSWSEDIVGTYGNIGVCVGEMSWKELKVSTIDENTRRLIQITKDDIEWCEQVLDVCMNDKSIAARKEFIMSDDFYNLI